VECLFFIRCQVKSLERMIPDVKVIDHLDFILRGLNKYEIVWNKISGYPHSKIKNANRQKSKHPGIYIVITYVNWF
jgi:hypothetical protein